MKERAEVWSLEYVTPGQLDALDVDAETSLDCEKVSEAGTLRPIGARRSHPGVDDNAGLS